MSLFQFPILHNIHIPHINRITTTKIFNNALINNYNTTEIPNNSKVIN